MTENCCTVHFKHGQLATVEITSNDMIVSNLLLYYHHFLEFVKAFKAFSKTLHFQTCAHQSVYIDMSDIIPVLLC